MQCAPVHNWTALEGEDEGCIRAIECIRSGAKEVDLCLTFLHVGGASHDSKSQAAAARASDPSCSAALISSRGTDARPALAPPGCDLCGDYVRSAVLTNTHSRIDRYHLFRLGHPYLGTGTKHIGKA